MSSVSDFDKNVIQAQDYITRLPKSSVIGKFASIGGIQSFQEIAQCSRKKVNLKSGEVLAAGEFAKIVNNKVVPLEESDAPQILVINTNEMLSNKALTSSNHKSTFQLFDNNDDVYYIEVGEGNNDKDNCVLLFAGEDIAVGDLLKVSTDFLSVEIADTAADVALFKAITDAKQGEGVWAVRYYKVID